MGGRENIRFEERLVVEQVDAAALAVSVPPMLLQTVVDHAVKHGIAVLPPGTPGRFGLRSVLQRLEGAARSCRVLRASRSRIVNLRFVERIDPALNDGLIVHLRTVGEVSVCRWARRLRDAWSIDR